MWLKESEFSVKIGGNKYINTPNILTYRGENIFKITRATNTDSLGIDFDIYGANGAKIAVVRNGRIYQGDKERFKVDIFADQYKLTDTSSGEVICDIKKRDLAAETELDVNVKLYLSDGRLFWATPEKTSLDTITMSGNTFKDCKSAIVIS